MVTALLLRVLATTRAKLGVANITGVLAVEQNILEILLLKVGALEDILKIGLGKT